MMTNDDIKNAENAEKMPTKVRILRFEVSKTIFLHAADLLPSFHLDPFSNVC